MSDYVMSRHAVVSGLIVMTAMAYSPCEGSAERHDIDVITACPMYGSSSRTWVRVGKVAAEDEQKGLV